MTGVEFVVVVVTAGFVDVVVVFGVVVNEDGVAVPVDVPAAGDPDAAGSAVELVPEEGVIVLDAGRAVSGVGTGGNGFDSTLAIRSLRPASDWLWRNL